MKFLIIFLFNLSVFAHEDVDYVKSCRKKIQDWPYNVPGGAVSESKDVDFICMYQNVMGKSIFVREAQKTCIRECVERELEVHEN